MFSPSPFPQTHARRSRRGVAGSLSPGRRPGVGSKPASRLPSRPLSSSSHASITGDVSMESHEGNVMDVDGSVNSARDVRLKGGVMFASSDELNVVLNAYLPMEVSQVLKTADFVRDSFTGEVDTLVNYCLIASAETCFVWQHSQSLLGTPTCYIFPCPHERPYPSPPFASLASYGPSREPALVLVSPGGEVRFWDSVGMGLTGADNWDASNLDLAEDETITTLIKAEAQKFVAGTSSGRLFLLEVSSTSGRFHITHHPFTLTRPQSTLSRLKFWDTAVPLYVGGNINAARVTNKTDEGFEVWACIETKLVKWRVMNEGWEQLELEQDINEFLSPSLSEAFPSARSDGGTFDLELVDIHFSPSQDVILLVSFAGSDDDSGMDTRPRRYYVVVTISQTEDSFTVEGMRTVPYQTISADRANIHPRLSLLFKGELYAVQFGDAVAIVAKGSDYSTCLTLRSLQDRTFGCGVVAQNDNLLFMNSALLMEVQVDMEKVNKFDPESGRGAHIKSIMTQAILYGSNPQNPLLFSFPPDLDEESLISGAEQLSAAVLNSDITVVRPSHDLTRQFLERKERLRFLIGFINENGALGKISQTSRQLLATDAEKLFAAQQLWAMYCERASHGHHETLLIQAISLYMQSINEGYHEDVMRAFFRLFTRQLGDLLPFVIDLARQAVSIWESAQSLPQDLPVASRVVLTVLQSAWDYRVTNLGVYGISPPFLQPWTSEAGTAEIIKDLFDATAKIVEQSTVEGVLPEYDNSPEVQAEAKAQLPELASALFACCEERLAWLSSPIAGDLPNTETEKRDLHDQYQQLRLPVLQVLIKSGHAEAAFQLAEEHRDFRSLAELCHSEPHIYPPAQNPHALRLQGYVEKYREEFADELYRWYIEHAELRSMFAESDTYSAFIDSFFHRYPNPTISWIHDLGKSRWGNASHTLLFQANDTPNLEIRHVMLSIGKLAQLAHASQKDPLSSSPRASASAQAAMDAFHDGLDYVSVHRKLVAELREPLQGARARQSLEAQVNAVAKACATRISRRGATLGHFKQCVKTLLQGNTLRVEDLIDVLTLKDNPSDQAVAVYLILNAQGIPEARQLSAFRTAWRRIYIHDNWPNILPTANATDAQLISRLKDTALYAALLDACTSDGGLARNTLSPLEAEQVPGRDELESRWPGHTAEQIDDLLRDYEAERDLLKGLELESVVGRVRELALQDAESDVRMSEAWTIAP